MCQHRQKEEREKKMQIIASLFTAQIWQLWATSEIIRACVQSTKQYTDNSGLLLALCMFNVVSSCVRDNFSDTLLMQNHEEESIWPMRKRFIYHLWWITVDSKHVFGNVTNMLVKKIQNTWEWTRSIYGTKAFERSFSAGYEKHLSFVKEQNCRDPQSYYWLRLVFPRTSPTILHFCSVL